MLTVEILPAARREIDESFEWYAEQSPTAAARFAIAVDTAITSAARFPDRCVALDTEHRACSVKIFPSKSSFVSLGVN